MIPQAAQDARTRMAAVAVELFATQGFAATTIDDVVARAGVTQRTFFRHFGDKEEVLFAADGDLLGVLLDALAAAEADEPVVITVRRALVALSRHLQPAREALRLRASIIRSDDRLRGRELLKVDRWRARLDEAMRARGVAHRTAAVAVGVGAACFEVAYSSWVSDRANTNLATRVERALDEVMLLCAPLPIR